MIQTKPSRLRFRAMLLTAAAAMLAIGACESKPQHPPAETSGPQAFEGSWNATGTRRTISLGGDRKGATIDLRGTMLLAGAGRPGVGFRADAIALADSETGLVGRGVWTDDHGDQVFSELKGEGTREKNHITGTILGGTGRYSNVTGTYEFSWQYMIESEDGTIQGRTVGLRGSYQLNQPAAGAGAGGAKQ